MSIDTVDEVRQEEVRHTSASKLSSLELTFRLGETSSGVPSRNTLRSASTVLAPNRLPFPSPLARKTDAMRNTQRLPALPIERSCLPRITSIFIALL